MSLSRGVRVASLAASGSRAGAALARCISVRTFAIIVRSSQTSPAWTFLIACRRVSAACSLRTTADHAHGAATHGLPIEVRGADPGQDEPLCPRGRGA